MTTQASPHYKLQTSLHPTPGAGLHPTPITGLHPTPGVTASHMNQQGYSGIPAPHLGQPTQLPYSNTHQSPAMLQTG